MTLRGTNSVADDDFSMMLKPGSYSPSLTFSVNTEQEGCKVGYRIHLCGTGNVCLLEGPLNACTTPLNSACRQHNGKSNLLNSLQILMSTSCCFPSLTALCSLISRHKRCFSDFTISVMACVNIEPIEERNLFSFVTKHFFNSEHCLPEHQFKPCMNGVPI